MYNKCPLVWDESVFIMKLSTDTINSERRLMMQLDDRSSRILEELISNPSVTSKDMEKKFELTRRQLGYSFDKVNSWLLEQNLPVIERTRQGHFIIDKTVFTKVNREQG